MPCNNGQRAKRTRKGSYKAKMETVTRKLKSHLKCSEALEILKTYETVENKPPDNLVIDQDLNKNSLRPTELTTKNETFTETTMVQQSSNEEGAANSFSLPHNITNETTYSHQVKSLCTVDMIQSFEDVSSVIPLNENFEKSTYKLLNDPIDIDKHYNFEAVLGEECDNYDSKDDLHKQSVSSLEMDHKSATNFKHLNANTLFEMADLHINGCLQVTDPQSQMCEINNLTEANLGQDVSVCGAIHKDSENLITNTDFNSNYCKSQVCEMKFDKLSLHTGNTACSISDITSNYLCRLKKTKLCDSVNKPETDGTTTASPPLILLKRSLHSPLSNSQVKKFKPPCQKNIPDKKSNKSFSKYDRNCEVNIHIEDNLNTQHQDGWKNELTFNKEDSLCTEGLEQLTSYIKDIARNANDTGYKMECEDSVPQTLVSVKAADEGGEENCVVTNEMRDEESIAQKQLVIKVAEVSSVEDKYPTDYKRNVGDVYPGYMTTTTTKELKLEETLSSLPIKQTYLKLTQSPHSSLVDVIGNEKPTFTHNETSKQGLSMQSLYNMNTDTSINEFINKIKHYQEHMCAQNDNYQDSLKKDTAIFSNVIDGGELLKFFNSFSTYMVNREKQSQDSMKSYTNLREDKDGTSNMAQEISHNEIFDNVNSSDKEVINHIKNHNERQESSLMSTQEFSTYGLKINDIMSIEEAQRVEIISNSQNNIFPGEKFAVEVENNNMSTEKNMDGANFVSQESHTCQHRDEEEICTNKIVCPQQIKVGETKTIKLCRGNKTDLDRVGKSNLTNTTQTNVDAESCLMAKTPITTKSTFHNQNQELMSSQNVHCGVKVNLHIHTMSSASSICQNENDNSKHNFPADTQKFDNSQSTFVQDTQTICSNQSTFKQKILDTPQSLFLPDSEKLDMLPTTVQSDEYVHNTLAVESISSQTYKGKLLKTGDLSNEESINSPNTNDHFSSTLNKETPVISRNFSQHDIDSSEPAIELHLLNQAVDIALPKNMGSSEDIEHFQMLDENKSDTSFSKQHESEVNNEVGNKLTDITQANKNEEYLLIDKKTSVTINKSTEISKQNSASNFSTTHWTSDNSFLEFDSASHHILPDCIKISNQQLSHLDKGCEIELDVSLSHSDHQNVSITQPDNIIPDQPEASREQSVTDFQVTNNMLYDNSFLDQQEACKEQPIQLATDFHGTSDTLTTNTVTDSQMDLSDSQICELTKEYFDHPFSATFPEVTDKVENPHNFNFEQNFESALSKSAKEIEKRKAEGMKLISEIMSSLVSVNKQLLRMKSEMETVRKLVQQQQHNKFGFSNNSNPVSRFGKGN